MDSNWLMGRVHSEEKGSRGSYWVEECLWAVLLQKLRKSFKEGTDSYEVE